jgi:hypothetical protein
MNDITGAEVVEVRVRGDGKVLWVNVNGECVLRICQIKTIEVADDRETKMNECVRTGLVFHLLQDDTYRTGDLFYYREADMFQIRGIPKGFEQPQPCDVTVMNCYICKRENSIYSDTNLGITLIAPSANFIKHIRDWYPELVNRIPGVKENGKAA